MDIRVLALILAASASIPLIAALFLTGDEVKYRRLLGRVRRTDGGAAQDSPASPAKPGLIAAALAPVGRRLRGGMLFPEDSVAQMERALEAAGLPARRITPVLIGAKIVLALLAPCLAFAVAWFVGARPIFLLVAPLGSFALAFLLPDLLIRAFARRFRSQLNKGLPDALDLLVVCADAGLGLESALERVAQEMGETNRAVAWELSFLTNELRILPDRRQALVNAAERTGLDTIRRFCSTLAQSFQYGTPLSQALRTLAVDMRQDRMIAMEEKAARLPAMLVVPMIVFILPVLLIILVGPAIIQLLQTLAANR